MVMRANIRLIKKGLLLLWAVWFCLAGLSNIADGLKAVSLLPDAWPFASANYALIAELSVRYHAPQWFVATLFASVIAWELYAAWLFWRAFIHCAAFGCIGSTSMDRAIAVSLTLWGAFVIADELLIAYAIEQAHRQLLGLELITVLFLELVPEQKSGLHEG